VPSVVPLLLLPLSLQPAMSPIARAPARMSFRFFILVRLLFLEYMKPVLHDY
jgi:hypothetical protein